MIAPLPNPALDELRTQIERIGAGVGRARKVLPFGVEALDRHLPGGGLALGALHEVEGGGEDITHGAAAALFAAGVLARLSGPVLWCLRRRDLFAPGLAGAGLHPDRVIYAEARDARSVLLVMEEGLRHAGLAGVVGEVDRLGLTPSRRLNLAAEASGVPAFVLRRWRGTGAAGRAEPTAAMTRWRIGALPSAPLPVPGVGRGRWKLELLRCRNGAAAEFVVEACDATGRLAACDLAVPAELGHGPLPAREGGRRAAG